METQRNVKGKQAEKCQWRHKQMSRENRQKNVNGNTKKCQGNTGRKMSMETQRNVKGKQQEKCQWKHKVLKYAYNQRAK